jgi:hypothetical protein
LNTETMKIVNQIDGFTPERMFEDTKLVPLTSLVEEHEIPLLETYAGVVIQVGTGSEQQLHLVQPYSVKTTGTTSGSRDGNITYVPATSVVVRDKTTGAIVGIPAVSGG